jgi:DNA-binding transcriptional LysR family regulator
MDHDALRLALETSKRGSFASVARAHGVEPSQVSRAVAQIEEALGFRLFQRTTRRLSLTEAGATYLQRADALLEGLEAARDEALAVSSEPRGVLRLTASVAFGAVRIVPHLGEFRDAFPGVSVEMVLTDANLDLVAERIDLAVRLAPAIGSDVIASKLMDVRYRVVAAPAHVRAAGPLSAPGDLAGRRCLLFDLPGYRRAWNFRDRRGGLQTVPVAGDFVFSSAFALYAAAKAGLGPALLPDWLVDRDIGQGQLVDLAPDFEASAGDFSSAAWLVYPSRAYLPLKVRAMIDFLRARRSTG